MITFADDVGPAPPPPPPQGSYYIFFSMAVLEKKVQKIVTG